MAENPGQQNNTRSPGVPRRVVNPYQYDAAAIKVSHWQGSIAMRPGEDRAMVDAENVISHKQQYCISSERTMIYSGYTAGGPRDAGNHACLTNPPPSKVPFTHVYPQDQGIPFPSPPRSRQAATDSRHGFARRMASTGRALQPILFHWCESV